MTARRRAGARGGLPRRERHGQRHAVRHRRAAGRRRLHLRRRDVAAREPRRASTGVIRFKPPLPAMKGLFGKPTVVNNVLSLRDRADHPRRRARSSTPTTAWAARAARMPFQLAGNIKHGGLVEKAFGLTLREAIYDFGGGTASGPAVARRAGRRAARRLLPRRRCSTRRSTTRRSRRRRDCSATAASSCSTTPSTWRSRRGSRWSSAPIESCGKCTPCRIGSTRGVEVIDRIIAGQDRDENLELLDDLCGTMTDASLCVLGGLDPHPRHERDRTFPRRFRQDRRPATGREGLRRPSHDAREGTGLRHAGARDRGNSDAGDRRQERDGSGGHLGDARGGRTRARRAQALRHRQPRALRLLPPLPRRDRGPHAARRPPARRRSSRA